MVVRKIRPRAPPNRMPAPPSPLRFPLTMLSLPRSSVDGRARPGGARGAGAGIGPRRRLGAAHRGSLEHETRARQEEANAGATAADVVGDAAPFQRGAPADALDAAADRRRVAGDDALD